ncbi:MAG: PAS domain S-box protein [Halobacteria archaeon]|nr:PAS domain S-box protein [Halobacteria archaeon]
MNDSLYELIVEESNDGVLVAQDGEVVYANQRLQEMTGYSDDEILGSSKTMAVAPEYVREVEGYHRARMEGKPAPSRYEVEIQTEDGDRVPVELSVSRVIYEGEPVSVSFWRDITETKEKTRELQDLKREYDSVFENVQDALFLLNVDQDGTVWFQRFNQREEEYTGKSTEEIRGKTPVEAFGEDLGSDLRANYRECVERQETVTYEEEITLGDETRVWQTKLTPVVVDGRVEKIVGSGRDITERKEYEEDLERARKRLRVLFDEAPDAMAIHGSEGEILDVNRGAVDYTGYSRDELLSMNVSDFEAGKDEEDLREMWSEMEPGETAKLETRHRRADGSTYPVEVWVSRIDVHGEPRYLALARDITERNEYEEELEEKNALLSTLFESLPVGVLAEDSSRRVLKTNQQMFDLFGIPGDPDEVVGNDCEKMADEMKDLFVDSEGFVERINSIVESNEPVDKEKIQLVDGRTFERTHRPVEMLGDDGHLWIYRDITQNKEYENELKHAREELRQVIDLVPDMIFAKNREGKYLLANQKTADVYGSTSEEIEGSFEKEVIPNPEDSEEFRRDDIEVIESGEPKQNPVETITTADGEKRVLQTTKIPYKVPGTGEDAVLGYARDVTELKEYEEELEEQRDSLEVLNQVVRHDIRNDLQLVLAYTDALEMYVEEEGEKYIEKVLDAARDAVDITTTARDVTEVMLQSEADRCPVNLRLTLENEVDDAQSNHENALITVDGSVPDVDVLANDMLESVFRNILNNAVQHNDKEVAEVTVSATVEGEDAVVRVADNGLGIPDERKEEIFGKGEKGLESEGTGIGLYLVHTLVDEYGGDVWVEDRHDGTEGSVFRVRLRTA